MTEDEMGGWHHRFNGWMFVPLPELGMFSAIIVSNNFSGHFLLLLLTLLLCEWWEWDFGSMVKSRFMIQTQHQVQQHCIRGIRNWRNEVR